MDEREQEQWEAECEANVKDVAAQGVGHRIVVVAVPSVANGHDRVRDAGRHRCKDDCDEHGGHAQAFEGLPEQFVRWILSVGRAAAEPLTRQHQRPAGHRDDSRAGQKQSPAIPGFFFHLFAMMVFDKPSFQIQERASGDPIEQGGDGATWGLILLFVFIIRLLVVGGQL